MSDYKSIAPDRKVTALQHRSYSELAVMDENVYYYREASVSSYDGHENDAGEGSAYPEDYEEGFELCKDKRVHVRIFIEYKQNTVIKLRTTLLL